jgi:iron(III) transport system substrate-binding protein
MDKRMVRVIRWGVQVAASCALIAAAAAAAAADSSEQLWNKTLAAAEKEGVVVVSGPPGAPERQLITTEWAKVYPKITLEYTGARGSEITPKIVRERTAGIYTWDVILSFTDPTVYSMKPIRAFAPMRDALIKPDLTDDKTWIGGFAAGFVDDAKETFYSAFGSSLPLGYANRDCISKAEFNKLDDLKKPELKGKIAWHDVTLPGASTQGLGVLNLFKGEVWLKDLFTNHSITMSRDYRQLTDWLVNCSKPIVMGMNPETLREMQQYGKGKNIEYLIGAEYTGKYNPGGAGAGGPSVGWFNNAPHPNAAKIFVNWWLSKEFHQAYVTEGGFNSRRVGTKPSDPRLVMENGVEYFNTYEGPLLRVKELQGRIKTWGVIK